MALRRARRRRADQRVRQQRIHDNVHAPAEHSHRGRPDEQHQAAVHGDDAGHGSGEPVHAALDHQHASTGPDGSVDDRYDGDENRANGCPTADREGLGQAGCSRLQGGRSRAANAQLEHQGKA